jgi:molecular chaperone GrpE
VQVPEKDLQELEDSTQDEQENIDNAELEECLVDLKQWKDSFLRINADFDNFKKRTIREKANWITEARAEVLSDLLNIVDNFDRAFDQNTADVDQKVATWLQGFEMIRKSLYDILASYDVKLIEVGLEFDPQFHEAITQIESADVESGQIVDTVQKGFMIKDRVLRVAKVVVAK